MISFKGFWNLHAVLAVSACSELTRASLMLASARKSLRQSDISPCVYLTIRRALISFPDFGTSKRNRKVSPRSSQGLALCACSEPSCSHHAIKRLLIFCCASDALGRCCRKTVTLGIYTGGDHLIYCGFSLSI